MLIALLMAVTHASLPQQATIEEVRNRPEAFLGQPLILCGEVSTDQSILYSATRNRFHGRVGIKLRSSERPGRDKCVTGRLLLKDSVGPAADDSILVTDSPVHPDYIFVANLPSGVDQRHKGIEAVRVVWALRQFGGMPVNLADPEAATIRFKANGAIEGTSACNSVGGQELTWSSEPSGQAGLFHRNEKSATITTAVGCSNTSAAALGDKFWSRMLEARRWSISEFTLRITFANGSGAVLKPPPDARR